METELVAFKVGALTSDGRWVAISSSGGYIGEDLLFVVNVNTGQLEQLSSMMVFSLLHWYKP